MLGRLGRHGMKARAPCARAGTRDASAKRRSALDWHRHDRERTTLRARKGFLFGEIEDVKANGSGMKGRSVTWTTPLRVRKYPEPCLRAKNAVVDTFDDALERLSREMFEVMYDTVGCGLAAPQVGVNYRLMVYNEAGERGQGKEVVLCNPKIVKFSKEKDLFEEGCLSFPKMYADVERPIGVQIEAQDLQGKKFKMTLEGFEARVFQHEYDHLDGVLYHDRMTPEIRAEVQSYLDSYVAEYQGDDKAL